jgi:ribonucleoside-diphosphate reductase alpha chain
MYKRSEVEKVALEFFKDSLVANVWLDKYALKSGEDEYLELSPDDTIIRLTEEISRIENTYDNPVGFKVIYDLLAGYNKLVLGGSPLFGIGNNTTLSTLGNCFVVDSPLDSYGGIFKTDQELAQLMKRRGGVGVDISTLRPSRSPVNNAAKSSTGSISFMERFSNTTREVAQEGRRGALMITMDITHPDSEAFIMAKDDLTKITGANISVKVSNDFMENIDKPANKTIWDKLIHQAWKNAEPGILFWDKIISESPADCYPEFKTISTNPCSELPLCAYDSCRLSAINLYAYVVDPFTKDAYFDYDTFDGDVRVAQRIMDDIIDLEAEKLRLILKKIENDPEPWEVKQLEYDLWNKIFYKLTMGRRTGLGQMGLADAGAALGFKYGSVEFIDLAEEINYVLSTASYKESIQLAKERGPFPIWNLELEKDQVYISRMIELFWRNGYFEIMNEYYRSGRRNIANLTIAPTGSISLLAGVSSGIEPVFALSYTRKRKVSPDNPNKTIQDKQGDWWEEYTVNHPKFETWMKYWENEIANGRGTGSSDTPYGHSTAHEVDPLKKLKLQAVIQPYIDHSISVTYNLPQETTEKEISDLYYTGWKYGLKGMTVYRDGSRDGILTIKKSTKFNKYDAPKRPKDLLCDVHNIMAKGRPWKVLIGLMEDMPYEVFAVNGKIERIPIDRGMLRKVKSGRYDLIALTGETVVEDITHNMTQEEEAFTRILSWALRHGSKLEFGVEQLNKSEGDITSFAKAISRTLKKYVKDIELRGTPCPQCGTMMVSEGGCFICRNCGNSKCE